MKDVEKSQDDESLNEELEKWFKKWMRKPVSGRCLIELKNMNKEAVKKLKENEEGYEIVSFDKIDKIFGEALV